VQAPADAFLRHLEAERRLSAHTVDAYARDLQLLGAFAAARAVAIQSLDRASIEEFVGQLMAEGRAPRSVARVVASWCITAWRPVRPPRSERRGRFALSRSSFRATKSKPC
jgi:site-specific recombinase XerC